MKFLASLYCAVVLIPIILAEVKDTASEVRIEIKHFILLQ